MKRVVKSSRFIVVVMALAAVTPMAAKADLIQNGSFEDSIYSAAEVNPFLCLYEGSTDITGWTVVGAQPQVNDSIDYIGSHWQASDGVRSLDLNGSEGTAGVEQVISTAVGNTYTVTFDMAGNPDRAGLKTMEVSAIGTTTQSALFEYNSVGYTRPDMGWETMYWSFTADSSSTTLRFLSTVDCFGDYHSWGPALDNVHVTPIPAALLLGIVGLGSSSGLLAWRRRRTL